MREIFTSGTVGGAPGNRCFYPDISPDSLYHPQDPFTRQAEPYLHRKKLRLLLKCISYDCHIEHNITSQHIIIFASWD